MARNRKPTPTKAYIIKTALELFFEKGFSKTTSTEICKKAEISKGNLTFYFPTKEDILAVLVKMMIDFQWQEMENATDEGKSSLLAYLLELSTLVSIGEEMPAMQDFFIAAYTHTLTLDLIRANDVEKIKRVFKDYTNDWDNERFTEAEIIISGIEYATLMKTQHFVDLERRIEGGMNAIMLYFGVPQEIRSVKIKKVLSMDYRSIGNNVYQRFKDYVIQTNEHALEEVLKNTKVKTWK